MTSPPASSGPAGPDLSRAGIVARIIAGLAVVPVGVGIIDVFARVIGGNVGSLVGLLVDGALGLGGVFVADRISWRNRDPRGRVSVLRRRASDCGGVPVASGLMADATWRAMCLAARLMPRAAGSRWLAEAGSFLFEAPPAQQPCALRNYLVTAPQVIAASWAGCLARRIRPASSGATARRSDAGYDPRS